MAKGISDIWYTLLAVKRSSTASDLTVKVKIAPGVLGRSRWMKSIHNLFDVLKSFYGSVVLVSIFCLPKISYFNVCAIKTPLNGYKQCRYFKSTWLLKVGWTHTGEVHAGLCPMWETPGWRRGKTEQWLKVCDELTSSPIPCLPVLLGRADGAGKERGVVGR